MSDKLEGAAGIAADNLTDSMREFNDDVRELIKARQVANEARRAEQIAKKAVAAADLRVKQALAKVESHSHSIVAEAKRVGDVQ